MDWSPHTDNKDQRRNKLLYDELRQKFNAARKEHNQLAKEAYEAVLAKLLIVEKSGKYAHNIPLPDSVVIDIINKQIKEYTETRSYYNIADREYINLTVKIGGLRMLLPEEISEQQVMSIIREAVHSGQINKGKIIGYTIKHINGLFDKSKIPSLVDKVLSIGKADENREFW